MGQYGCFRVRFIFSEIFSLCWQPILLIQRLHGVSNLSLLGNIKPNTLHRLSALLYEATENQTYADAAQQSFKFIKDVLYDGSLVHDRIDLGNCEWIDIQSSNSGYAIEGVSIYTSKVNDSDASSLWVSGPKHPNSLSTYHHSLNTLLPTAIKNQGWTGHDGIVLEGKPIL